MKYRLLSWLCCPECRSSDLRLETVKTAVIPVFSSQFTEGEDPAGVDSSRGEEQVILSGALHCGECGSVYPIRDGVPRMMPKGADDGPNSSHAGTVLDVERPEWENNFQELMAPLKPGSFIGKLVLDAGGGFGRHAFFAARYGAEVVCLDTGPDTVAAAQKNLGHLSRTHVVQGCIYSPPFREATFDLTYCLGVLHHLKDPKAAFRNLGTTVKPGGRLSLFVYGPRQGLTLAASNTLRAVTKDMSSDQLMQLSGAIARGLRLFSHTPYRALRHVPVAHDIVSRLPVHDHHQWAFEVVVADVYDRLRVPVHHWFSGEELEGMLTDDGYADVQVTRRVRNNETFRATGVRR